MKRKERFMANWEVEKKINLGDMLTVAGMFFTMVIFVGAGWVEINQRIDGVAGRVAIQENMIVNVKAEMAYDRANERQQFEQIITEIRLLRNEIREKADK